jgi:hypothetical protein
MLHGRAFLGHASHMLPNSDFWEAAIGILKHNSLILLVPVLLSVSRADRQDAGIHTQHTVSKLIVVESRGKRGRGRGHRERCFRQRG